MNSKCHPCTPFYVSRQPFRQTRTVINAKPFVLHFAKWLYQKTARDNAGATNKYIERQKKKKYCYQFSQFNLLETNFVELEWHQSENPLRFNKIVKLSFEFPSNRTNRFQDEIERRRKNATTEETVLKAIKIKNFILNASRISVLDQERDGMGRREGGGALKDGRSITGQTGDHLRWQRTVWEKKKSQSRMGL